MSKIRLVFLSGLAVLIASAAVSASVSAQPTHWYYCELKNQAIYQYANHFCSRYSTNRNSGLYELYLRSVGKSLSIEGLGTAGFVLKTKVSGITLEITDAASEVKSTGWFENIMAGEEIRGLGLSTTEFKNPVVATPSGLGCTASMRADNSKTLLVSESETTYDEYKEDPSSNPFTVVTITSCTGSGAALNGTYNVTGLAYANVNNETSSLEFEKGAPNNKLKFGGNTAEFTGLSEQDVQGTTDGLSALT